MTICSLTIAGIADDAVDVPGVNGVARRSEGGFGEWSDSLLFGCEWFFHSCSHPYEVPLAPRMGTIPLPSEDEDTVSGGGDHRQYVQWKDASNQDAEVSTSLAAAKPKFIEYETVKGK